MYFISFKQYKLQGSCPQSHDPNHQLSRSSLYRAGEKKYYPVLFVCPVSFSPSPNW